MNSGVVDSKVQPVKCDKAVNTDHWEMPSSEWLPAPLVEKEQSCGGSSMLVWGSWTVAGPDPYLGPRPCLIFQLIDVCPEMA